MATASSAALDKNSLTVRAYAELLERITLLNLKNDSPALIDGWKFSLSNGVAAHTDLEKAKLGASNELIERGQILKSWYGKFTPQIFVPETDPLSFLREHYQITWLDFSLNVTAALLKPIDPKRPVIFTSAKGLDSSESMMKTANEVFQKILFSWEEEVMDEVVMGADPLSHLDYYASIKRYDIFTEWISGERQLRLNGQLKLVEDVNETIEFDDITPIFCDGKIHIVRAKSPGYMPLVFGIGHPHVQLMGQVSVFDLFHPLS